MKDSYEPVAFMANGWPLDRPRLTGGGCSQTPVDHSIGVPRPTVADSAHSPSP